MHAQCLGDIPQNQRLHVLVALLQKFPLTLDDAGGHLEQGLVAILQALEKPARLLQMVFQIGRIAVRAALPRQGRVSGVDAQLGHVIGVQLDPPGMALAVDQHVRHDVLRRGVGQAGTRTRVQRLNQAHDTL